MRTTPGANAKLSKPQRVRPYPETPKMRSHFPMHTSSRNIICLSHNLLTLIEHLHDLCSIPEHHLALLN